MYEKFVNVTLTDCPVLNVHRGCQEGASVEDREGRGYVILTRSSQLLHAEFLSQVQHLEHSTVLQHDLATYNGGNSPNSIQFVFSDQAVLTQ
jgi:hypothetical protein